MRVLIAGGAGFIGSRLVAELRERGHETVVYDIASGADVVGDVTDEAALAKAARNCEALVNLAAVHRDDVRPLSLYDRVNVDGARAVVAAAEKAGVRRILFLSTVAVYGLDNEGASEDAVPEPFNEYGRSKLRAEAVLEQWRSAGPDRYLVIVRPSVVFGEANRGNVYNLAQQVHSRRFVMIGPGSNQKSMSYVGNLVDYLAGILDDEAASFVMNYADKPDLTTEELVRVIRESLGLPTSSGLHIPLSLGMAGGRVLDVLARLTGRTLPISSIRIRKFASSTIVNTERLEASGYRPRVPLAVAIRSTIRSEFPTAGQEKAVP